MDEEINDQKPAGQEKNLPPPLDSQLRALLPEKDLEIFRDQLPDGFLADATEGLSKVRDASQLDTILKQLNHQMRRQLSHQKKQVKRKSIRDLGWTYWAIIIILLLTICAFIIIRMLLHH